MVEKNSLEKEKYFEWCKNLKNKPVEAEQKAIELFRKDEILKHFVYQVPVYFNNDKKFIMDFFSIKYLTSIEIDGEYHFTDKQQYKDIKRSNRMRMRRIWTVRVTDDQILNSPLETINYIKAETLKRKKTGREKKFLKSGNPHRTINRLLACIDNEMFGLPRIIKKRNIEKYSDKLPAYIIEYFTKRPDSISKRKSR